MEEDIIDKLEEFKPLTYEVDMTCRWVTIIVWNYLAILDIWDVVLDMYTRSQPKSMVVEVATTLDDGLLKFFLFALNNLRQCDFQWHFSFLKGHSSISI